MNCGNHPERNATAFCRECGRPMCEECQRPALGSVYCAEHAPETAPPPPPPPQQPHAYYQPAASSPYAAPYAAAYPSPNIHMSPGVVDASVHPLLALILGFIPGVGAIYNGQYAKGLIHAVIFGLLVNFVSNARRGGTAAFLGIMIAAWVIYQAFEAYHTARKRRYGIATEEFSSLLEVNRRAHRFPVGAILLIGLGFVLLLETTEVIRMDQLERFWPVGLIGLGVYLFYNRMAPLAGRREETRP